MDKVDILDFIRTCDDREFLLEVNRFAVERSRNMGREATSKFRAGQRVKFFNTRFGHDMEGTVKRVKTKNILVNTDEYGDWNVNAAALHRS